MDAEELRALRTKAMDERARVVEEQARLHQRNLVIDACGFEFEREKLSAEWKRAKEAISRMDLQLAEAASAGTRELVIYYTSRFDFWTVEQQLNFRDGCRCSFELRVPEFARFVYDECLKRKLELTWLPCRIDPDLAPSRGTEEFRYRIDEGIRKGIYHYSGYDRKGMTLEEFVSVFGEPCPNTESCEGSGLDLEKTTFKHYYNKYADDRLYALYSRYKGLRDSTGNVSRTDGWREDPATNFYLLWLKASW